MDEYLNQIVAMGRKKLNSRRESERRAYEEACNQNEALWKKEEAELKRCVPVVLAEYMAPLVDDYRTIKYFRQPELWAEYKVTFYPPGLAPVRMRYVIHDGKWMAGKIWGNGVEKGYIQVARPELNEDALVAEWTFECGSYYSLNEFALALGEAQERKEEFDRLVEQAAMQVNEPEYLPIDGSAAADHTFVAELVTFVEKVAKNVVAASDGR